MTQWIDPVPSVERNTNGILMVIGTEAKTTDCSLVAADADIFTQLARLTVIKENETLRLVCMWREKKTKRRNQRVSSVISFPDQQARLS